MSSRPAPRETIVLGDQEVAALASGVRILAIRSLGDVDAADEVVQETLARALEAVARGRLLNRAKLGAFVRGIARHVITDEIRLRSRIADMPVDLPDSRGDLDQLAVLIRREDVAEVRSALARLSESDRDIIHLSFVEGLSPAAIADRSGVPADRIRKRKSRAVERLRTAFLARAGHDVPPFTTHRKGPEPREPSEGARDV